VKKTAVENRDDRAFLGDEPAVEENEHAEC
jgi:hypothetical protein